MIRRACVAVALLASACTPEDPRILSVAALEDTRDLVGPYTVQIVARGLRDGDVVELRWSIDGEDGPFAPNRAVTRDVRDDVLYGSIPGQVAGVQVDYFVVVLRDDVMVAVDPPGTEGVGDAAPPAATYSFRVLSPSAACVVDTDCSAGVQICVDGTCRVFGGSCVETGGGSFDCPDGYVCDTDHDPLLCVIAPRPCSDDSQCPTVEECDRDRNECMARAPCSVPADCPSGYTCHPTLGLCFRN